MWVECSDDRCSFRKRAVVVSTFSEWCFGQFVSPPWCFHWWGVCLGGFPRNIMHREGENTQEFLYWFGPPRWITTLHPVFFLFSIFFFCVFLCRRAYMMVCTFLQLANWVPPILHIESLKWSSVPGVVKLFALQCCQPKWACSWSVFDKVRPFPFRLQLTDCHWVRLFP